MKKYKIGNFDYCVLENYRDGFIYDDVLNKYTEYFEPYDYILGDYCGGVLRLKGFCEKGNSCYKRINDFSRVQDYIKKHCSYECKYFILKKEI